jgi:hypothetical protein
LDDKKHGKGTYVYKNGNRYSGDWVADNRTGIGIFYFLDGAIYIGD